MLSFAFTFSHLITFIFIGIFYNCISHLNSFDLKAYSSTLIWPLFIAEYHFIFSFLKFHPSSDLFPSIQHYQQITPWFFILIFVVIILLLLVITSNNAFLFSHPLITNSVCDWATLIYRNFKRIFKLIALITFAIPISLNFFHWSFIATTFLVIRACQIPYYTRFLYHKLFYLSKLSSFFFCNSILVRMVNTINYRRSFHLFFILSISNQVGYS